MAADQETFNRLRIKLRGAEAAVKKARVGCNSAQRALDNVRSAGGDADALQAAEAKLSSAQVELKRVQEAVATAEKAVKDEQERLEAAGVTVSANERPKPSPAARNLTPSKPRPGPPPAALGRKLSAAAPAPARPPKAPKPAPPPKLAAAPAAGLPPPAPATVSSPAEPAAPVYAPRERMFPIEDSEIDEFDPGRPALHAPRWLPSEDDSARLAAAMYVCEAAGHFAGALGLQQAPTLAQLRRALAAGASDPAAAAAAAPLSALYHCLLAFLLEDARDEGAAPDWCAQLLGVLTAATWPEVLRRWLCRRAAAAAAAPAAAPADKRDRKDKDDVPPVSLPPGGHLEAALEGLAAAGADGLAPDTHLALLHWLLDEALATARMRGAMQDAEEAAVEGQRTLKATMTEERRKVKELTEASREAKRQRVGPPSAVATPALEPPCFALPEELREYLGDPGDAAARAAFDKRRAKEEARLEREQGRWEAGREKERAVALERSREGFKAEAARQTGIEAANEAVRRAQEKLEALQEGLAPRRAALGADRLHRRYWAFPLADPATLYVEDEATGLWGAFSAPEDLRLLAETLDRRGEREAALEKALARRRPALTKAMLEKKNGEAGRAGAPDKGAAEPTAGGAGDEKAAAAAAAEEDAGGRGRRLRPLPRDSMLSDDDASSWSQEQESDSESESDERGRRQRARAKERAAQEEATRAAEPVPCFELDRAAAAAAAAPLLGPSEALAYAGCLARLLEVRQVASAAGVPGPGADPRWEAWTAAAGGAARGQMRLPAGGAFAPAPSADALCALLQARALEIEAAVTAAGGNIADPPLRVNPAFAAGGAGGGGDAGRGQSSDDAEGGAGSGSAEEGEEEGPAGAAAAFEVFRGREASAEALRGISMDKFMPSCFAGKALWRHRRDRLAWQAAALRQGAPAAQVAFWVEVLARQVAALLGGGPGGEHPPAEGPKPKAARGGQRKRTDRRRRRKKAEQDDEEDEEEEEEEEEEGEDMNVEKEDEVVDLTVEEPEQAEEEKAQRGAGGRKRRQDGPPPAAAARRTARARTSDAGARV